MSLRDTWRDMLRANEVPCLVGSSLVHTLIGHLITAAAGVGHGSRAARSEV